jgi:RNA polymerase sigma-70 factor (ECF subfamily)
MHDNHNKAEFLRLYTAIQPKLYSYILAVVHNRSDAEDLFQEASVVMWDKYEMYDREQAFGAWAIGIAKNKVFEYLRNNKKTKVVLSDQFYCDISELAEKTTDDVKARIEALNDCMGQLREKDRKLMSLRFYSKKTVRDISQLLERSTNSLYKSYTRIICLLQECVSRKLDCECR